VSSVHGSALSSSAVVTLATLVKQQSSNSSTFMIAAAKSRVNERFPFEEEENNS
jgi:hypothetical protein